MVGGGLYEAAPLFTPPTPDGGEGVRYNPPPHRHFGARNFFSIYCFSELPTNFPILMLLWDYPDFICDLYPTSPRYGIFTVCRRRRERNLPLKDEFSRMHDLARWYFLYFPTIANA